MNKKDKYPFESTIEILMGHRIVVYLKSRAVLVGVLHKRDPDKISLIDGFDGSIARSEIAAIGKAN